MPGQHHGFLRLGPPGRLPMQLHARHRTRPVPGRTHLWQIPERTGQTHHPVEPFLRAVRWREQGWARACELSDHLPAGCRAGPEGSTSLPGRKPRRGRRGARLREWGRGSHQSLEKPWRKVRSRGGVLHRPKGLHSKGEAESWGWRSHSRDRGAAPMDAETGWLLGALGCRPGC